MKTFAEFILESKTHELANHFIKAYGEHASDAYHEMKNSFLHSLGRVKAVSGKASDMLKSHGSMSPEEFEAHVIHHYVPHLKKHGFPKPFSKEWGDAQHDFTTKVMKSK